MPYIKKERREELAPLYEPFPETAGELNFIITDLCDSYLVRSRKAYADYNEIVGVLESAKLEFYRRLVSKYEDEKRKENGEVYSNA